MAEGWKGTENSNLDDWGALARQNLFACLCVCVCWLDMLGGVAVGWLGGWVAGWVGGFLFLISYFLTSASVAEGNKTQ